MSTSDAKLSPNHGLSGTLVLRKTPLLTPLHITGGGDQDKYHLFSNQDQLCGRSGLTLTWRDLSVYAKIRHDKLFQESSTEYRRIISNVSGAVPPGTLVAMMGASGAGKSTLMAALAYQTSGSVVVDGDIRVNGRPIGPFMRHLSGFMDQEDLFIGCLTVTEYLRLMARLKLDRRTSAARREFIINQLLTILGLSHCADTRISASGDKLVLSGGEKKRLSFATACLTDPPLLFCDEPTTGLDSYGAATIVEALQTMAARGKTVFCTIHQPSSELFTMFHQLILVADGKIAYLGTTSGALDFFESQGYPCPESYNPADYLVRLLAPVPGAEGSSRRSVRHLCDQFAVSDHAREVELQINFQHELGSAFDVNLDLNINSYKKPFLICKLWWLTINCLLEVIRDPKVQQIRLLHKVIIALMVGLCFVDSVHLNQNGVQATQGALFMLVTENTFGPMYSTLNLFPTELPLFLRHYRAGLYTPLCYYLAKTIASIPGLIVEPVLFTAILYWLAGLQDTLYAFFMTSLVVTLCMNVSAACGCFFSAMFESVPMAMTYLIPFDYSIMITSGVFIKLDTLTPQYSWIQYISWMMYSNEAMTIVQWQDIQNISRARGLLLPRPSIYEHTVYASKDADSLLTRYFGLMSSTLWTWFTCDQNPELPCLHSGQEVLDRYSFSEDHLWRDIYALCALTAAFHILAYVSLRRRVKKNS